MFNRITGPFGYPDILNHILNFGWGRGCTGTYKESNYKIDEHTHKSNSFGGYTKPIGLGISEELEVYYIGHRKPNSTNHTGNGAFLVYFL